MVILGDAHIELSKLPDNEFQTCITSPPYYGLRDYGNPQQIGTENCLEEYLDKLLMVFKQVFRVLREDGILWVNIGDAYNESGKGGEGGKQDTNHGAKNLRPTRLKNFKPKELLGIPWRLAFALQDHGFYLRQDIVWYKPNPMTESVKDRCTRAHEYLFLLSKSRKYYYDHKAIMQQTTDKSGYRNHHSVWIINTEQSREAHYATFPIELPKKCIMASTRVGDKVLDPFAGTGTTGAAAIALNRLPTLIELSPRYAKYANAKINNSTPPLFD